MTIDFSWMRLSNWESAIGTSNHITNAFDEIENIIEGPQFPKTWSITLNFEGNYLQDKGVELLVDFIKGNDTLNSNVVKIDVSNNRFTKESLDAMKSLLESCTKLTCLDLSINYLSAQEVDAAFAEFTRGSAVQFSAI